MQKCCKFYNTFCCAGDGACGIMVLLQLDITATKFFLDAHTYKRHREDVMYGRLSCVYLAVAPRGAIFV